MRPTSTWEGRPATVPLPLSPPATGVRVRGHLCGMMTTMACAVPPRRPTLALAAARTWRHCATAPEPGRQEMLTWLAMIGVFGVTTVLLHTVGSLSSPARGRSVAMTLPGTREGTGRRATQDALTPAGATAQQSLPRSGASARLNGLSRSTRGATDDPGGRAIAGMARATAHRAEARAPTLHLGRGAEAEVVVAIPRPGGDPLVATDGHSSHHIAQPSAAWRLG